MRTLFAIAFSLVVLILSLSVLILSLSKDAQADDMTLLGVGNGGKASAAYTAPAVVIQGNFVSGQTLPAITTAGALSGVSNGPKGLVSFWTYYTGDNTGTLYALGSDQMGHNSHLAGGSSSEWTNGFNIVFDNEAGTTFPNMSVRINLNQSTWTGGTGSQVPEFGFNELNAYSSALFGTWVNWIVGWDNTTSTHCGFLIRNGTNIVTTLVDFNPTAVAPSYTYANSSGFTVGPPVWNQENTGNGGLGETYINLNPTGSGNICSGNAPVGSLVSKFYSSGNPVDLGTNCTTPGFGQPAMCFRGNLATSPAFTTNQGTVGAMTVAGQWLNFPTTTLPTFPSDHRVHQRWIYAGRDNTTGANTPFATTFGSYPSPPAGDLLLLIANKGSGGKFAVTWTDPTLYTRIYTIGGSTNFESTVAWYKISTGSETAPSLQSTTSNVTQDARWVIVDYGNVNGSTPIGANITTQYNDANGSSSCAGFTPSAADSLIAFISSPWPASAGPFTLSSASMQTRLDPFYTLAGNSKGTNYIADMQNSGSTVVPTQTLTYTATDAHGCGLFEIEHN